jgi:hypothetical protein
VLTNLPSLPPSTVHPIPRPSVRASWPCEWMEMGQTSPRGEGKTMMWRRPARSVSRSRYSSRRLWVGWPHNAQDPSHFGQSVCVSVKRGGARNAELVRPRVIIWVDGADGPPSQPSPRCRACTYGWLWVRKRDKEIRSTQYGIKRI